MQPFKVTQAIPGKCWNLAEGSAFEKLISLKACPLSLTFQRFSPPSRQRFESEHRGLLSDQLEYVEPALVSLTCVLYFALYLNLGQIEIFV